MSDESLRELICFNQKRQRTLIHMVKQLAASVSNHIPAFLEIMLIWGLPSNTEGWVCRLTKEWTSQNILWNDKCTPYKMLALINLGKQGSVCFLAGDE